MPLQNNPFVVIEKINVRLTIKEKNDGGSASVDGGESGTFIPFTKTFVDVRSITVTARRNASFPVIAIYDFDDEDTGGFTAYILKLEDGTYVNGTVDWAVRGV